LAAWGVAIIVLCGKCRKARSEGDRFWRSYGSPVPIATGPGVVPARPVAQQTSGKAIASLPLLFFFFVLAAALAGIVRARLAASESSAVNSGHIVNTAEITYQVAPPASGYTCSLSDLSDQTGPELLALAGRHAGYLFHSTGCAPDSPGGINVKYPVVTYPQTFYPIGVRAFCCDESGVIKHDLRGSAQACLERGEMVE
jgi:hypothetical protein